MAERRAPCPASALVDTVKNVDADGVVTGTPDRASLRAVQTPQGFAREVLVAAHAQRRRRRPTTPRSSSWAATTCVVVEGDPLAFKVTTRDDLEHAERVLAQRAAAAADATARLTP